MAINRFTGASSALWSLNTNWSQGTVPTANDGHVTTFDASSPNCTVSTPAKVCNNLDMAAYPAARTITLNVGITVSGNFLNGAMNINGVGGITLNANGTLTSGGNSLICPLTLSAAHTWTLADNWTLTSASQLTMSSASSTFTLNGFQMTLNCSVTNSLNIIVTGTTKLVLGTGTFGTQAFTVNNNIDHAGNVTYVASRSLTYQTGIFTWISGTWTNGISIGGSCTLNLAGLTVPAIEFSATNTTTLTSALVISTMLFTGGNTTFAGSFGFTCTTYTSTTAGTQQIYTTGNNYIVTTTLTITGTAASKITLKSASAGNQATFYLQSGASQDVGFCISTDINSSSGITIWDYKGTLSNTTNWNLLTIPNNIAYPFILI